jgi:hypothetical protein
MSYVVEPTTQSEVAKAIYRLLINAGPHQALDTGEAEHRSIDNRIFLTLGDDSVWAVDLTCVKQGQPRTAEGD